MLTQILEPITGNFEGLSFYPLLNGISVMLRTVAGTSPEFQLSDRDGDHGPCPAPLLILDATRQPSIFIQLETLSLAHTWPRYRSRFWASSNDLQPQPSDDATQPCQQSATIGPCKAAAMWLASPETWSWASRCRLATLTRALSAGSTC